MFTVFCSSSRAKRGPGGGCPSSRWSVCPWLRPAETGRYVQRIKARCSRFCANQLRVLLTAAAYVLMQELRLRAASTSRARAQMGTLRFRLLILGVRVVGSVRRIVLHLPVSTADASAWRRIALSLGARPGVDRAAPSPRHIGVDVCLRTVRVRARRFSTAPPPLPRAVRDPIDPSARFTCHGSCVQDSLNYTSVESKTSAVTVGAGSGRDRRLSSNAGASILTMAPSLVSAHRTGRAGFPHPALRLVSRRGTRPRAHVQRTQPHDAERAKDLLGREAPGPARRDLMPSPQKVTRAGVDVIVDGPIRHHPGAVAEVVGPPAQSAIEPRHPSS